LLDTPVLVAAGYIPNSWNRCYLYTELGPMKVNGCNEIVRNERHAGLNC